MRLHNQIKLANEKLEAYEEQLNILRSYLNSSKFSIDTTVQTSDIILRLNEIDATISIVESDFEEK